MFICGSGSFSHEDQVDNMINSPCSTPKRSKRSTSFCKNLCRDHTNKNPYADRGLDKFYALLADLDDKKQKIYTQKGSEDISFVRFVYTNDSDKVKPIVVKLKDKKPDPKPVRPTEQKVNTNTPSTTSLGDDINPVAAATSDDRKVVKKRRSLRLCNGGFRVEDLRRPQYYFPVMVVLILLFLAVYGRSFAILCTSIGWYLVPTIAGAGPVSSESKAKRKEYGRRVSERKSGEGPASPRSVINGLNEVGRVHHRKKSW